MNTAPWGIGEALYAHPEVVEAAAFPRDCPRYGEQVEAAMKLVDGAWLPEQVPLDFFRERVGKFLWCPDVIRVLRALPDGPSGKIQRLRIAEITAQSAGSSPSSVDGSGDV